MPWQGWVGVTAAVMMTLLSGAAKAEAVDCWLLDGKRTEQPADSGSGSSGRCDDAFSRNSRPGEAPALGKTASLPEPPPAPPRALDAGKPVKKPAAKSARTRSAPGGPHVGGRPVRATPSGGGSGGDFLSNFQRDFGALVDLLSGGGGAGNNSGSNHRRTQTASGLPSHSGR